MCPSQDRDLYCIIEKVKLGRCGAVNEGLLDLFHSRPATPEHEDFRVRGYFASVGPDL